MRIAFLGCGYVANMYRLSLPLHPQLRVAGAYDRDADRAKAMAAQTGSAAYASFADLLADRDVDLVLNLTNPGAHYELTKACLEAGKHVYTEKPLAMRMDHATELVNLAEERGLCLSSAPCTLMSAAAQTLWRGLRDQRAGRVRLVYAEMEDGMVHRMPVQQWVNEMGVPWPYVDEFETGCTVEHAGYVLSWLAAYFGPAESVTAFSTCLVPDKLPGQAVGTAADFSVGCIRFADGVVARLTCGIYAPHDHRLRIFGDDGVLELQDPRSDDSPIRLRKFITIRRARKMSPFSTKLPLLGGKSKQPKYRGSQRRDFCRSIAEMADAIAEGRQPYITPRFCLHINEVTLALQNAMEHASTVELTTRFDPIQPLPWATA